MPGQRKALGRGLSALLGTPDLESDRLRDIDIDRIVPDPNQPRTSFDKTGLEELAASIRTHGVVQPIVIRPLQDGVFQIVAGERRWRATQLAGLETMPALVRDTHEHLALELALVENLQREDLNAIDQARAYQRLLSEFSLTQEKLASRVGKSRASVANILRLLKLPEEVQKWLQEGVINAGHAKALLSLPDADAILESAREIIKGSYSVRQAEALVSKPKPQPGSSASGENPAEDPNVRAAIRALERALGTKVAIRQPGGKGKGKIEIHFHSQGELNRPYNGVIETRF